MANVNGGLMANKNNQAKQLTPLAAMLKMPSVRERFEKMLGDRADAFLSSLLSLTNNNKLLAECDPGSILGAAAQAAALNLPINPNLGFAWVVPYKGKATFQIGYKGYIRMFQNTKFAKDISMECVYEGEIRNWNRFAQTYEIGERLSDCVVGYFASFETTYGFKKCVYVPKEDVLREAKKLPSFNRGPWQTDTDKMAMKSVLSRLLRTYAPMDTEMQDAIVADNKINTMNDNGEIETETVDLAEDQVQAIDVETGEILKGE